MIPNMKFYVVTIVAIFLALAIGIFVGFTLDAQNVMIGQREDMAAKLEEKFDYLRSENVDLKKEMEALNEADSQYKDFINKIYPELVKNRLSSLKVAIIETNDDYIYSGIGKSLELSGASVSSIITIKDKFLNEDLLLSTLNKDNIDEDLNKNNVIESSMSDLTKCIITGEKSETLDSLIANDLINIVGDIKEPVDFIIVAGGSSSEEDANNVGIIDKRIIEFSKKSNVPVIGVEKTKVKFSYIDEYKNLRISTVDNVDTVIGKVALIMAMEGRPGNYGIKPSSEELIPDPSSIISEWGEILWILLRT